MYYCVRARVKRSRWQSLAHAFCVPLFALCRPSIVEKFSMVLCFACLSFEFNVILDCVV